MERGAIPIADLPGGLDVQSTLESGQTYHWGRADGRMYETTGKYGGSSWYHTVVAGDVIRARQIDGVLEWESTTDAVPLLTELLRLDDDLDSIIAVTPDDPLLTRAYDAYRGMRIVRDPFFRCLISFICSAQMRVDRIYAMQEALTTEYGAGVEVDGTVYREYPTPERLADASVADLRTLGLGYRAPYVKATAEMVAAGDRPPRDLPTEYEGARDALKRYVGVGDKVADCVLLFSLGRLEAVPLDTWIQTAIDEYYPACDRGTYRATSRAIRERFGDFAGYAQTYVFHYLRHTY